MHKMNIDSAKSIFSLMSQERGMALAMLSTSVGFKKRDNFSVCLLCI